MGKNLEISLLFDFYGELLTQKQQEAIELYYNEDLSLAEIAEHFRLNRSTEITRQGVRDSIKLGERNLLEMEEKLGMAKRFGQMQQQLDQIVRLAKDIAFINTRRRLSDEIGQKADEIVKLANQLKE